MCRCPPSENGPNGGKLITVKTCIPIEGHSADRVRVTIMLQSKARPVFRYGRLYDGTNFYWFFICQSCRKSARRLDPWQTVRIEKTEIDHEGRRGPITALRDFYHGRDPREPALYEEDETWTRASDENGYDAYGRGSYWSPPQSPPPSPPPVFPDVMPSPDPWDHSGADGNELPSQVQHPAPIPSLESMCHDIPQGSEIVLSPTMRGIQPDGDASAGSSQSIATYVLPELPGHVAMPASNTLGYWGRMYFNVVRDSMIEEHWYAINADPWQDPPASAGPPTIMDVWAQLTFMLIREERTSFAYEHSGP